MGEAILNRLEEMIQLRGVCYPLTPAVQSQLTAAKATPGLLTVVGRSFRDCRPTCSIPPEGFAEIIPQRALDFASNAIEGHFDLKLEVDQSLDIVLRGASILYREASGRRPLNIGSEYSQPIPTGELIVFDVVKKEGRGTWKLTEKPSDANCHSARIHIEDPKPGTGRYHLVVLWRKK